MKALRWLVLPVAAVVAVLACIAYIDRPLAEFLNETIANTSLARIADLLLLPLRPFVLVAFVSVIVTGLTLAGGRRMNERARPYITAAVSVILAIGAEFIFKQIFGRGDVSPTFIRDHQYGFDFLHAHDGWWSFPSGTALGLFAVVGVAYAYRARTRSWILVVAGLLSTDTVLLNYHWLSDIIAGAFMGLAFGYATAGILTWSDQRQSGWE